jgi:hypothetical protein
MGAATANVPIKRTVRRHGAHGRGTPPLLRAPNGSGAARLVPEDRTRSDGPAYGHNHVLKRTRREVVPVRDRCQATGPTVWLHGFHNYGRRCSIGVSHMNATVREPTRLLVLPIPLRI